MPIRNPTLRLARLLLGALLLAAAVVPAVARHGEPPYSLAYPAKVGVDVPTVEVAAVDVARQRALADARVQARGAPTKRLQVAVDNPVSFAADRSGRWETLADGSALWRLRVRAAGATDLRLGFGRFVLPPGATLHVIGADDYYQGPYTAADAGDAAFHAPVVPGDTAMIELHVPAGVTLAAGALELTGVGAGFRDVFGRKRILDTGPGTSGACNIDVVCPLGQPYPDPIRAVGQYEYQAADDHDYYVCSGTLVADVPHDRRNYFLTAAHCITAASEAASMVIYWNYQSTRCGQLSAPPGGFLADDQHGAALRARRADVDFTLVELSHAPESAWNLYYAGWDASGIAPRGTIGIHHPSGDVKKITAGPVPTTIDSCIADNPAPNTHWKTGPYTQGTTEGGSSGSGLFVVAGSGQGRDRRLIGTLSGGFAACSTVSPGVPNGETDCYGKFSIAWNGPSAGSRLRDWLDPAATGATSIAGIGQNESASAPAHSRHAIPDLLLRQPRVR